MDIYFKEDNKKEGEITDFLVWRQLILGVWKNIKFAPRNI